MKIKYLYLFVLGMVAAFGLTACEKETKIAPPTVRMFSINPATVGATKVNVSAEVSDQGGAKVTMRGFIYGQSESNMDTLICGSGVGLYSVDLVNLESGKDYVCYAFAKNEGGTSDSNKESFTTKTNALPTVVTGDVSDVSLTSAWCTGEVTDEGSSTVTARGVCYGVSHDPTINGPHTINGTGTGTFTSIMTDLAQNTTYYVRSYATNSSGTSYGVERSFTTKLAPTVQTAMVTSVDFLTAVCGGEVTAQGGSAVTSRGVCWSTSHNPSTSDSHCDSGAGVGSFTIQITDLYPGTTYYVRAYAINSDGTAYGEQLSFTTLSIAPGPLGSIAGRFSVSDNLQVHFSKGNLQHQPSSGTWSFAATQYETIGSTNYYASPTYTGWIDLFGWGTSGYDHGAVCYQPYSTDAATSCYYAYGNSTANLYDESGQADWGYNAISNGGNVTNFWRTLKKEEWKYVFDTRNTPSGIRFAKAQLGSVLGIVLLPDDWNSSHYNFNNVNQGDASYYSNLISAVVWRNVLEPLGAVFLPVTGERSGQIVGNLSSTGSYWSSSSADESHAYRLSFLPNNVNASALQLTYLGLSVRLVCQAD